MAILPQLSRAGRALLKAIPVCALRTRSPAPILGDHLPALDGYRGLALLAVLTMHTTPPILKGGALGVNLFFILSGFLITRLLLHEHTRTGRIDFKAFYLRRALRLFPALVVMLAIVTLLTKSFVPGQREAAYLPDLLAVLGYYYNWRVIQVPPSPVLFIHAWSLSVEEQFYLVWPGLLAVFLALRVRPRWLVGFLLLGILAPALIRMALWTEPPPYGRLYVGTDTNADSLCAGILVAILGCSGVLGAVGHRLLRRLAGPAFLVVGGYLVYGRHMPGSHMYWGGFTILVTAGAILLAGAVYAPPRWLAFLLQNSLLGWCGRVSYGIYLWNVPIYCWAIWGLGDRPALLRISVQLAGSIAAGVLSYYVVERPCLRLRESFRCSRRPQQPADHPAIPSVRNADGSRPSPLGQTLHLPVYALQGTGSPFHGQAP